MKVLVIPDIHLKPWIFERAENILQDNNAIQNSVVLGDIPDDFNQERNLDLYVDTFRKFVDTFEPNGTFIYYSGDSNLQAIAKGARKDIQCRPYSAYKGDVAMQVFGQHNMENLQAACQACETIGVKPEDFYREISTFTWAVPPFRRPSRPLQKENMRSVMSDSFSTLAMKMNSGAASMV